MNQFISFLHKKLYFLFITLCLATILIFPKVGFTLESLQNQDIKKLEYKVAKGYSNKFCNAIAMGVSKDGALKLSIAENAKPEFNTSLWFDLAFSKKKDINKINNTDLATTIAEDIVDKCGRAINLTGEKNIEELSLILRELIE